MKLTEKFKKSLHKIGKDDLLTKLQEVCEQYLKEHPKPTGGFLSTPQKSQAQATQLIGIITGIKKESDDSNKRMAFHDLIEKINTPEEGLKLTGNDSLRSCLKETVTIAAKNNAELLQEDYLYMTQGQGPNQ